MAVIIDGTLGVTTPTGTGDVSVGDDLIFTGTGNRITGDFSNATESNRVGIQSSTTNGATAVSLIPNGTSTFSGLILNNSSDVANSSQLYLQANGSSYAALLSGKTGTGTYLPIAMFTGGAERLRIDTSGNVGIGTSTPSASAKLTLTGADTAASLLVTSASQGNTGLFGSVAALTGSGTSNDLAIASFGASNARFYTNSQERLRIDSSGNVGIGTSSLTEKLHVNGNVTVPTGSSYYTASTEYGIGTPDASGLQIFANVGDTIRFGGRSGTTFSERMRIDSSGNLLVGATSSYGGVTSATGGWRFSGYASDANPAFLRHVVGSSETFLIYGNGNTYNSNGVYGTISDARVKENVVNATPKLQEVMQIRVVNYNLIGDTQKQIGVIAQELEQVFPGLVDSVPDKDEEGNETGTVTKRVKYSVFVPILIKTVQEQQAIIKSLQDRITALEQA